MLSQVCVLTRHAIDRQYIRWRLELQPIKYKIKFHYLLWYSAAYYSILYFRYQMLPSLVSLMNVKLEIWRPVSNNHSTNRTSWQTISSQTNSPHATTSDGTAWRPCMVLHALSLCMSLCRLPRMVKYGWQMSQALSRDIAYAFINFEELALILDGGSWGHRYQYVFWLFKLISKHISQLGFSLYITTLKNNISIYYYSVSYCQLFNRYTIVMFELVGWW